MAGCVIIPAADEKRAESQKTAFARVCALQPSYRVWPNRARIIRGRAFDPRLWVRPIACAFAVVQKPQQRKSLARTFVHRVQEAKAAAEKKKQFCGLVPGLQPVKTAGALHPSAAEKNGRKTALPGDGSQLRPWPPSAPRLARCACECVRARWAVAVFAFDIVI